MSNTNLTTNKRTQLKAQLDDFATFKWRGHDMFDDFGCFIINETNTGLKFYNGFNFSNKYSQSQFNKSTNGLLGIEWKQQTIPMKVGLYWFTIEEYQEFLNCISPYEINYLTFDFEPNYSYLVKLGKMEDSPRYIVGRNDLNQPVYYTEMTLTWELLGDSCVRSNLPYEWSCSNIKNGVTWTFNPKGEIVDPSLLDTPVIFEIPIHFKDSTAKLTFTVNDSVQNTTYTLFDINLTNLPVYSGAVNTNAAGTLYAGTRKSQFLLRYDSESGLMYIQEGDEDTWHLLNYQTDNAQGEYLLQSAVVNKWKMLGKFKSPSSKPSNYTFSLRWFEGDIYEPTSSQTDLPIWASGLIIYARKNIV